MFQAPRRRTAWSMRSSKGPSRLFIASCIPTASLSQRKRSEPRFATSLQCSYRRPGNTSRRSVDRTKSLVSLRQWGPLQGSLRTGRSGPQRRNLDAPRPRRRSRPRRSHQAPLSRSAQSEAAMARSGGAEAPQENAHRPQDLFFGRDANMLKARPNRLERLVHKGMGNEGSWP
jgi:hypothetical protein